MPRYCNWSTETPVFQRCLNLAEEGEFRCAEHRRKRKSRSGNLTQAQKEQVRKAYDYKCAYCGQSGYEVDHIVELNEFPPGEKWKANLPSNLQVLCFTHHVKKTNEYRRSLIDVGDPNDTTTTGRNRKRKRRRAQGLE